LLLGIRDRNFESPSTIITLVNFPLAIDQNSIARSAKAIISYTICTLINQGGFWFERYDRELTDVFAIQDEISQAIASSSA